MISVDSATVTVEYQSADGGDGYVKERTGSADEKTTTNSHEKRWMGHLAAHHRSVNKTSTNLGRCKIDIAAPIGADNH